MIRPAQFDTEAPAIRALINEYLDWLGYDLAYQGIDAELDTLAVMYGAPGGGFLVVEDAGVVVGCVGVRPLREGVAEMKRLYVRPACQGCGYGKGLISAGVELARTLRYRAIMLDAAPRTAFAQQLYLALGFEEIAAYAPSPIPDTRYYALALKT
jgi:GNAT superfamily N-acetyltransferase